MPLTLPIAPKTFLETISPFRCPLCRARICALTPVCWYCRIVLLCVYLFVRCRHRHRYSEFFIRLDSERIQTLMMTTWLAKRISRRHVTILVLCAISVVSFVKFTLTPKSLRHTITCTLLHKLFYHRNIKTALLFYHSLFINL